MAEASGPAHCLVAGMISEMIAAAQTNAAMQSHKPRASI